MSVDLALRAERRLVGADQPGDRKPRLASADQKLRPRAERMRQADVGARRRLPVRAVADDEAAADREPGLVGEGRAVHVAGDEPHCVRMARRGRHRVERNFRRRIEDDRAPPGEFQPPGFAHLGGERLGRVWFDTVRALTAEAENDRLVGRVAAPSEGERTEQRDLDRSDAVDRAGRDEPVRERGGGFHRPDRMRRRRPDADFEQFENAEHRSHRIPIGPKPKGYCASWPDLGAALPPIDRPRGPLSPWTSSNSMSEAGARSNS